MLAGVAPLVSHMDLERLFAKGRAHTYPDGEPALITEFKN